MGKLDETNVPLVILGDKRIMIDGDVVIWTENGSAFKAEGPWREVVSVEDREVADLADVREYIATLDKPALIEGFLGVSDG